MMFYCKFNRTCDGHLGKFSDCLSEALYCHGDMDGGTGNVDWGVHLSTYVIEEPTMLGGFTVPAGFYAMIEDQLGFTSVTILPDKESLDALFEEWDSAYRESGWFAAECV